jgi:DNA-binding transcriptional LysR family regulator
MPRNLDTALLRTFVTAAEHASMTVAAKVLHLSQGAVSQHVRRLEELLACSLFVRESRGLRLSASGERLFGKAKRILAMNDDIWNEMTSNAIEGRVRLGVPPDLVSTYLPPAIKAFAEAFPQVDMSLMCASSPELAEALAAGKIDLALIEEQQNQARPGAGECLAVERLVWVGAKAGAAHLKRPLPISLVADTCVFRPVVLDALQAAGVGWRAVFEQGGIEATAATVRTDLAVTAWLVSTVPSDLTILAGETGLPALPNFAITLHLPRHDASPAALELASHIRTHLTRRTPLASGILRPIASMNGETVKGNAHWWDPVFSAPRYSRRCVKRRGSNSQASSPRPKTTGWPWPRARPVSTCTSSPIPASCRARRAPKAPT